VKAVVRSPFQKAQAVEFVLALRVSSRVFITAGVLSARAAGTTHEQLNSAPSKGAPSLMAHLRDKEPGTSGRRLSHSARPGVLRQLAFNSAEMGNPMPPLSDGEVHALRAPMRALERVRFRFLELCGCCPRILASPES